MGLTKMPKIEVTEQQYKTIITECSGLVFHKQEKGKFFIKIAAKKFEKYVKQYL